MSKPIAAVRVRRMTHCAVLGLGLLLCAAQTCMAQGAVAPTATRDPAVLSRLAQMGDYLRSLKSFVVKAETAKDEVLESGQKVQFSGTLEYRYAKPDRLRASFRTDRKWRDFYFDGKTLTQVAPRWATTVASRCPARSVKLMTGLAQRYGIEMPLADLFFWGTPSSGVDDITSAMLIGPARVGGVETDHFALRQAGVDWQIWVERGARPLPHKMVITTTEEPAQPQFSATSPGTWAPRFRRRRSRMPRPRTPSASSWRPWPRRTDREPAP